jgi:hypothetical protein
MDIKKDIQGRSMLSQQATGGMESFSISLGKKCERLATALYLVTSFLPDSEPLKGHLRTLSLDLVRDASRVRYGTISSEANVLEELRANIGETLGLLELALIAGLVSEMNFSILKREYTSLRGTIEIKKASRESRTDAVLGDTFFGSSFTEDKFAGSPRTDFKSLDTKAVSAEQYSIGHSQGQKDTMASLGMSDTNRNVRNDGKKTSVVVSSTKTSKGRGVRPSAGLRTTVDVAKDSRRTRILKLVKDNREVTIKDITTYFPELSEKTIQRELVAFVEEGVLKKFGERRWSRYTIA